MPLAQRISRARALPTGRQGAALALLLLAGLAAVFAASCGGSDKEPPPVSLSGIELEQLRQFALRVEDIQPDWYADAGDVWDKTLVATNVQVVSADGFLTTQMQAAREKGELTQEEIDSWKALGVAQQTYNSPHPFQLRKGPQVLLVWVSLHHDEPAAEAFFEFTKTFYTEERLRQQEAADARRLVEIKQLAGLTTGDASNVLFWKTDRPDGKEFKNYFISFRRGELVGRILLQTLRAAVNDREVTELAQKLLDRMP